MKAPFYVAAYGGFLVVERYRDNDGAERVKVFTEPNVRMASVFDSFDEADSTAKWAIGRMYPPDIRYFAILGVPD